MTDADARRAPPGPVRRRPPYGTEAFAGRPAPCGTAAYEKASHPCPQSPSRLPVFPWDKLEPYKATAAAHPDGIVDLSVGTPVDPVPELIQQALVAAADSPGYPTVWGTAELRDALTGWVRAPPRRGRTSRHANVLPVVGSKELVAWLPTQLGLGAGDQVAYPRLAYPTYEVGARLAAPSPSSTTTPPSSTRPA